MTSDDADFASHCAAAAEHIPRRALPNAPLVLALLWSLHLMKLTRKLILQAQSSLITRTGYLE